MPRAAKLELLSFYVLFESTLILLFILVGIYGSINKEKAAYYILLYTLFGSLFMLLSICITTYLLKSTSYYAYNGLIISIPRDPHLKWGSWGSRDRFTNDIMIRLIYSCIN